MAAHVDGGGDGSFGRRSSGQRLDLFGFTLDLSARELRTPSGQLASLRRQALDVLLMLGEQAGHVVGKQQLMQRVWPNVVVGEDSLVQAVADIRRALGDGLPIDSTPRLALAVLPLSNLSGSKDQDYLTAALTNDLITDLSRLPQLMVVARASTVRYAEPRTDLSTIGRELNARYLLQGSLDHFGERLGLNLQLIEAATGRTLWAERFEADRLDPSGLRQRALSGIARPLQLSLVKADVRRRIGEGRRPDAQDLAMQGWYLWIQNRPESVARARELLQRAVALDPTSAYAWAVLGFTYMSDVSNDWLPLRGHTRSEWLSLAKDASDRAYELEPELLQSIGGRAFMLMTQGDLEQAIALREKQIAISPSDSIAHHNLAYLKLLIGRPQDVLSHEQQAMRVSPRDPKLQQMHGVVALAALHMQRYGEALDWAERAIALDPTYASGYAYLAAAAAQLGDQRRASIAIAQYRRLLPGHGIRGLRDEQWTDRAKFLSGQEIFYAGLRTAGLPE